MSTILLAPSPWPRLTELAKGGVGLVAVPFVSTGARRLLPLGAGSTLITRVDAPTVKAGQVDPAELLAYLKSGVEIHSRHDLHAKVYVFGRRAVVGSANVSATSASMSEACLETTESSAVSAARSYVLGLRSVAVGPDLLKTLVPLFPKGLRRLQSRGANKLGGAKVFVVPVHEETWDEKLMQVDKRGLRQARERVSDASMYRLEKVPLGKPEAEALSPGDIVVYRWSKGRGFLFEPPSLFVHAEFHPDGAIVYTETRKRLRDRTSADVRAALGKAAPMLLYPKTSVRQLRSQDVAREFLRLWQTAR